MYGTSQYDLSAHWYFDEVYVIVDATKDDKWYLRSFDSKTNRCAWTNNYKKAVDFDSEDDAIKYASKTGRSYLIEQHDGWIF